MPAAELGVIVHDGTPAEIDRAYGALATYVADHALAAGAQTTSAMAWANCAWYSRAYAPPAASSSVCVPCSTM